MNLPLIIGEIQGHLASRGFEVDIDSRAGPQTFAAIYHALLGKPWAESTHLAINTPVDERSEKNIATLLPEVQPYARALIHKAREQGIEVKVISGTRTYAEQDALFKKRPQVTKARGGYSNHNFGVAFDVGVFQDSGYLEESPLYGVVGSIGLSLGLEWGGNWTSFHDEPHFQLRPRWASALSESQMLAQFRTRVAEGKDLFATA